MRDDQLGNSWRLTLSFRAKTQNKWERGTFTRSYCRSQISFDEPRQQTPLESCGNEVTQHKDCLWEEMCEIDK